MMLTSRRGRRRCTHFTSVLLVVIRSLLVLLVRGNHTETTLLSKKQRSQNDDDILPYAGGGWMDSNNSSMTRQQQRIRGRRRRCSSGLPRSHHSNDIIILKRKRKRNRKYRIITPSQYDPTRPSKVVLYFHGWGEDSSSFGQYTNWVKAAQRQNYIIVAAEGIQYSWQFPGSSNGIGYDGTTITTCDTSYNKPYYCYSDTCPCKTRCGWTHCQDDDLQFVLDLIQDIHNYICVDEERVYAAGISNGAMLTWSLAQDHRIAPYLAGIAPMIGVPHYDYKQGKASPWNLPVIGIYGNDDSIVPPGNFNTDYTEDSGSYYWIPAHRMHTRFAKDHGCVITKKNRPPPNIYYKNDNLHGHSVVCRTYCDVGDNDDDDNNNIVPYSVDCRVDMKHDTPAWMLTMALRFFEQHYEQSRR